MFGGVTVLLIIGFITLVHKDLNDFKIGVSAILQADCVLISAFTSFETIPNNPLFIIQI